MKPFLEEPYRQFNVCEIARILNITPASKQLKYFTKELILEYEKQRNYALYKGNIDNIKFRDLKVYY